MTMTSDNEKDAASNPEISEKKEEVQDEKEPDEESKATPGSSSNIEPTAESIEDSGPEPHEEATPHDKVDPTGEEEKKPAEEEDTRQTLAQASPAPAAKSPSPKNKKKSEQHSEHSVEGDDMEDDRDDPHDDGDDKSSDSGKGGGNKDDFRIPTRYTKSGRRRATPFPLKLMKVLSTPEFNEVIAWTASGRAFNILQPKVFVAKILPDHFKSAKYSSFTRKLHRWGFMRHYRGEEAGAFFHRDFQRDRMDLVEKMTCYKTPQSSKPAFSPRALPMSPGGREMSMLQLQHQGGGQMMMMDPHGMGMMPSQLPGPPFSNMHQMSPMQMQQQFAMQQQHLQQQQMALMQQQGHPQMSNMHMSSMAMQHPQQHSMMMMYPQHPQQNMPAQGGGGRGSAGGDVGPTEEGGGGQRPQEFNAAIEMEVARRLKERINAAAMSRQALHMMQHGGGPGGSPQQQQQQQMMDNRYNPYYQQQGQYPPQQGQAATSMSGNQPSGGQSSSSSNNNNNNNMGQKSGMGSSGVSPLQQGGGHGMASRKQPPFDPTPLNYNAFSDLHGFGSSLPPTNSNIQGAKTA